MKEPDSLDDLLREWTPPDPTSELDQRVIAEYRSAIAPARPSPRGWRQFWTMRISVPAPALLAVALVIAALVIWLRRTPAPPPSSPTWTGAVTQLSASGFQPLPNGEARVIPAREIPK